MTKIQINLSEEESKKVSLYKIFNKLKTKEAAIKEIINKFCTSYTKEVTKWLK